MSNLDPTYIEEFLHAYFICALWSSLDEQGRPLDDLAEVDHIHAESKDKARAECISFIEANKDDLDATGADASQHGHDLWLTRNHHGAGFWDRGYGEVGKRLTEAAEAIGQKYATYEDEGDEGGTVYLE